MPDAERFIAALLDRHAAPLRRSEFLKAIRALSARYVERRAMLADRSPLDSPGKRAAFAAYYAPLHYLTVGYILDALGSRALDRIVDLGCGTGVAGAAWASWLAGSRVPAIQGARNGAGVGPRGVKRAWRGAGVPAIQGIDRSGWAVTEAAWTYRALDLKGRATRGDLVLTAESLAGPKPDHRQAQVAPSESRGAPAYVRQTGQLDRTGVVIAWSGNELDEPARRRLLASLVDLAKRGAAMLVVEPISRRAAPWIDDWAKTIAAVGGRQDDWRFEQPRPAALAEIDDEVGFSRDALTARSLAINLP